MSDPTNLCRSTYRVLKAISDFTEEHGYAPSIRDLAKAAGLTSPASGKYHVDRLQRLELIDVDEHTARSIRLTEKGQEALNYIEMEPSA